jgi:hypothetical protein
VSECDHRFNNDMGMTCARCGMSILTYLQTQNASLRTALSEAEAALVSLTPGGSEYVGDPKKCAEYVRLSLSTAREVAKRAVVERKEAEAEREHLRRGISELSLKVQEYEKQPVVELKAQRDNLQRQVEAMREIQWALQGLMSIINTQVNPFSGHKAEWSVSAKKEYDNAEKILSALTATPAADAPKNQPPCWMCRYKDAASCSPTCHNYKARMDAERKPAADAPKGDGGEYNG